MKGWLIALAFFVVGNSAARADVFQQWEQDPYYKHVQELCVQGDPVRSLTNLQAYELKDSALAVKGGLVHALLFWKPDGVESHVQAQWYSIPFVHGLIDCFGNDEYGLMIVNGYLAELVLSYSTIHAVTEVATIAGSYKVAELILKMGFLEARDAALNIEWLQSFLESSPNLLPRVKVILPWIKFGLPSSAGVLKGVESSHAQAEQEQAEEEKRQAAEKAQIDLLNQKIDTLQMQYKSCSHDTCALIAKELDASETQLMSLK